MMKKRLWAVLLTICLVAALLPTTALAAGSYADTNGHWAESSIERWSAYGIIQGSNGQFDPNGQLTCAQLATILAKLLKLPAAKDAGFSDNKADAWYYDAINRCAAAGILNGNGDGTVTPEAPITRERAMVMLGRALGIEPIREPDLTKYTDAAKVAPYAQGMVAAMIEAGIVGGVTAGELAPQDNINRAATVTILDRAISTYADEAGATVRADGKGIVLVVAENVKITGAPEGAKIVVADGATGLSVNGKSVSDDQTYIVPKTTPASGSSSGGYSHTHSYDTSKWVFDDTTHWHASTCGHNLKIDEAAHTYNGNNVCTVCGQVKADVAVAKIGSKNYKTLAEAVAAGGEVKLLKDVDISETVIVTKAIKLDLNGKTISNTNDLWEKRTDDWSLISVRAGGDLTITGDGTLKAKENDCYAVDVQDGAKLTIENGTFVGNIHAVYVNQGELTVKGGAYSIQQKYPDTAKADEFVLNCYDANFKNGTAKITVTGGTFEKFNPANCAAEGAGTNFVAAGYAAKELEGDKYQVVALFDGGTGTAEDPFLIATSEQFKAIDQLNGTPYCFKQTADIAVAAGDEVTKFAGVYDGGNQKLSSARTSGNFAFLFNVGGLSGHATFKNINVAMGELATSLLSCADWGTSYGADFENLTFTSTSELTKANSSNFGFVVSNAIYTGNGDAATYNFKDITVNVNLQNAGTCTGVLIGSGPCFNVNTTMNFTNCTNNGTITGTNSVGFLYGNSAYIESLDSSGTINVTNCTTNAVIKSTKDSADVAFAPGASKSTKADALNASYQQADKYIVGNCLNGKTISVTQNAGADKFSIAIDDASGYTYKLVLNVAATYRTLDGEAWNDADVAKIPSKWDEAWNVSNGLKYLIALSKDTNITGTLNSFHAYDKRTAANKGIETNTLTYNEDGYAIVVKNGTNCVVFNTTEDTYIDSSVSILVYAYSGNTLVGTRGI